jgi:transcription antitermination factor NusG
VATDIWYALYTRHQHEKVVAGMLSAKGFETFLPLRTSIHRWKNRNKTLSLPLFPSYVFLKANITDRRLDILTTPGIHNIVSNGGQPAPISSTEIEAIRRVIETGLAIEAHPFLKCGDWVMVTRGMLTGIRGILVRKKGSCRLVLSVEMLGKAAAVEVDATSVEPLRASRRVSVAEPTRFPAIAPAVVMQQSIAISNTAVASAGQSPKVATHPRAV